MNKQRKVLITVTYNEMGIIIDTKAEEVAQPNLQPNLQPTCNQLATNTISRQAAIDAIKNADVCVAWDDGTDDYDLADITIRATKGSVIKCIEELPSAQPETAKRIVGNSRDGMILWYQCDMCNEPVDAQDNFCRGCGRRLTDE